ncbi:hypothetical protein BDN72DRAFT_898332 [Pluteus cervinus]|uniref:Uncharacterized protein n=1 Tax=Pluteus cervinus TaxID=181527 RepID=A0ACD3ARD2_9AGAR|nr:hypothetical protein BDN72DRAFT_898332 [Pluteus cervinus]
MAMDRGAPFTLELEANLHPRLTLHEVEEIEAQNALRRRLGIQPSDREIAMTLLAQEARIERDLELANRIARGEDDIPAPVNQLRPPPEHPRSIANSGGIVGRRPSNSPVQQRADTARPQAIPQHSVPPSPRHAHLLGDLWRAAAGEPLHPARPKSDVFVRAQIPDQHQHSTSPTQSAPSRSSTSSKWWKFRWLTGETKASGATTLAPVRLTGHNCAVCQDPIRGFEYRAPCGDYYDKECLVELFTLATQDESLYPPRCCRQHIPVDKVLPLMSPDAARKFRDKATEFGTLKRVYCAVPSCSRFLGPEHDGGRLSPPYYPCPACRNHTCTKCKGNYAGPSHGCGASNDEREVLSLGQQEGWARCPGCNQLIELHMGCYHMTCRCRTEFCYLCKERWKTCGCVQWDENRLLLAAEQRVDAQFGRLPAARPAPLPPLVPLRPTPAPARVAPAPVRPAAAPVYLVPAPIRPALAPTNPFHDKWLPEVPHAPVQVPDVQFHPLTTAPVLVAQPFVIVPGLPQTPATPPVTLPNPQLHTLMNPFGGASDSSNVGSTTTTFTNSLVRSSTMHTGSIPTNSPSQTRENQLSEELRRSMSLGTLGPQFSSLTLEPRVNQNRTSSYMQPTLVPHTGPAAGNNSAAPTVGRSNTISASSFSDRQTPARPPGINRPLVHHLCAINPIPVRQQQPLQQEETACLLHHSSYQMRPLARQIQHQGETERQAPPPQDNQIKQQKPKIMLSRYARNGLKKLWNNFVLITIVNIKFGSGGEVQIGARLVTMIYLCIFS